MARILTGLVGDPKRAMQSRYLKKGLLGLIIESQSPTFPCSTIQDRSGLAHGCVTMAYASGTGCVT